MSGAWLNELIPQYRARVYKGAPVEVTTLGQREPEYVPTGWQYVIYDQHRQHGMQIIRRSAWADHAQALAHCLAELEEIYAALRGDT